MDKTQRPRRNVLNRLRSYNQFPLQYKNIAEMTADLSRIQKMGFNNVWVNPLFEPCQNASWIESEITRGLAAGGDVTRKGVTVKTGSIYSTHSFRINKAISNHANEAISEEERKEKDYADVRTYTDKARKLGMTPMYDLVMRHISVDNPLVQENPQWFKRHENGNFVFFGRDENYKTYSQSWDDVLEFNYDNPQVRHDIIERYLKPMVDIVVGKFGFQGLRIDAAGKIPASVYAEIVPYIDEVSIKNHGHPAVIMGETLGQNVEDFTHTSGYMDYVYNSIYFQPFNREFWDKDDTWFSHTKGVLQAKVAPTVGFPSNHDVVRLADYYLNQKHVRGQLLRQVISSECVSGHIELQDIVSLCSSLIDKKALSQDLLNNLVDRWERCEVIDHATAEQYLGCIATNGKLTPHQLKEPFKAHPVSSAAGSAAVKALVDMVFTVVTREKEREAHEIRQNGHIGQRKVISEDSFIKLLKHKLEDYRLTRMMKEAFCFTAFASDGGWFLSRGEEFGVTKRTDVFVSSPDDIKEVAYPAMDFSKFIASVNATLAKLPPMVNPEWVQRCYLENDQNKSLASFFVHQGEGYTGGSYIVIANVGEEKQILGLDSFQEIRSANGRNIQKQAYPNKVYLCGDIQLTKHLSAVLKEKGVEVVESESHAKIKGKHTTRVGGSQANGNSR